MANSLLIEKETGGYFGFTLTIDGVVQPKVRNMRNDAFAIDNIVHFKTATGANIVKQQNISIYNITLIASGTFQFTDIDTFIEKLVDVGYWEWMLGAGSGGADRFDEMLDTFDYFGNDMKGVRVNESQMKLEPFTVYNYRKSTDLEDMPSVLIPNKMFVVNEDATGVVLKDQPETPITYLNAVGTFHYADLATQTVPLVILPATPKKLTNDAEGVYTNLANTPYGVSSVWNTATNQLDFTQLSLGDTLTFRLDAIITTSAINQTAKAYIKFGVGSLSEFDLIISQAGIKTAGSYPFVSEVSFDLAYQDIVDNPAEIYIESDDDATLKINGWYIEILRKNINIVDLPTSIRQDVDFGVISSDAVDAINNAIPNILIQDQNLGQIKIQGTFNGVYHEYLFTGIKGYYGNGALQCTLNDLIEIGGSGGGGGATNLEYTASPTQGTVLSDTGTDATIPLADNTNAGLLSPTDKIKLDNTGDQDLQSVLDNGNTAIDSSITLENTENSNNTYINSNYIQLENPSINEKIQLISDDNSGVFINITDNNNSSVFNIKKDRLFWNNGSGENELILSRTSIDRASYSFPEKPTGNYTLATTSDGIPITGTTVDNPVTGNIEVSDGFKLIINDGSINIGGLLGNIVLPSDGGAVNNAIINYPITSSGLSGEVDYSPNITDLDYPQKIYVDSHNAIKPFDEGNGIGWSYGTDRTLFGNIGLDAIDFSYSDTVSGTLGATGENSFNTGINNTSSGYSSSTFGFANETSALGGFTTGFNNKNAGYTNLVTGTGHDVTGMSMTVVGQASNVITQSVATFNEATSPVFVVGNGVIEDANPDYTITSRSDALIVRKNGVVEAPSQSIAEIDAGTNKTLVTKEYVSKRIIRDLTPSSVHTGTVNETIIKTYLIPANTFSEEDVLNIENLKISKAGTNAIFTYKVKINTTPSLSGAITLAYRVAGNTALYSSLERSFIIKNGLLKGMSGNQNGNTDKIDSSTTITSNSFNVTVDNYIMTTFQLNSVSDSAIQEGFIVKN